MSEDKRGSLPSLRRKPIDFLSRDEAREAVRQDAVLDLSGAADALSAQPGTFPAQWDPKLGIHVT